MTDRAKLVLHGFFQLSLSERQDFIDELNRYQRERDQTAKKSLERTNETDFNRIVSGPISSGCACCGR